MTCNARLHRVWHRTTPFAALLLFAGCATQKTAPAPDPRDEELAQARHQVDELREQVVKLSGRLEGMELQVATLQDEKKAPRPQTSPAHAESAKPDPDAVEVRPPATEGLGRPVAPTKAQSDPDAGFSTDAAVAAYRKGMMLFEAKKFPESMLAFTNFLEAYADHPWAGSAQFYVGQSYFFQKECRLALQEYERVLTSYDRSPHVADALRQMATCEDELKMPVEAAKHRQLLSSLFPNSPAAHERVASATASPQTPSSTPPTAPVEGSAQP